MYRIAPLSAVLLLVLAAGCGARTESAPSTIIPSSAPSAPGDVYLGFPLPMARGSAAYHYPAARAVATSWDAGATLTEVICQQADRAGVAVQGEQWRYVFAAGREAGHGLVVEVTRAGELIAYPRLLGRSTWSVGTWRIDSPRALALAASQAGWAQREGFALRLLGQPDGRAVWEIRPERSATSVAMVDAGNGKVALLGQVAPRASVPRGGVTVPVGAQGSGLARHAL